MNVGLECNVNITGVPLSEEQMAELNRVVADAFTQHSKNICNAASGAFLAVVAELALRFYRLQHPEVE